MAAPLRHHRSLSRCSFLGATFMLLIGLSLIPQTATADRLGLYIGSDGLGLSFSTRSWAFYGDSWHDPGWSLDFDVALDGYGEWIWVEGLGRVWHPHVAADWRPYTHGRWMYTSAGWTWVAYEPWGYIPHHFGEWALTVYGWTWVPGYDYRPAHVVWIDSGPNIGWYPCPPRGWSHSRRGFHHGYHRGYDRGYRRGYRNGYGNGYDDGFDNGYWRGWNDARYATYVHWNHLTSDDISRHSMDAGRARRHGSDRPARHLAAPPSSSDVRRRTGRSVPRAELDQRSVRVGDRDVTVARPRGVERSLADHAETTVDRALSPEASRRARSGSAARVHTQPGRVQGSSGSGSTARVTRQPARVSSSGTSQDTVRRGSSSRTSDRFTDRSIGRSDGRSSDSSNDRVTTDRNSRAGKAEPVNRSQVRGRSRTGRDSQVSSTARPRSRSGASAGSATRPDTRQPSSSSRISSRSAPSSRGQAPRATARGNSSDRGSAGRVAPSDRTDRRSSVRGRSTRPSSGSKPKAVTRPSGRSSDKSSRATAGSSRSSRSHAGARSSGSRSSRSGSSGRQEPSRGSRR